MYIPPYSHSAEELRTVIGGLVNMPGNVVVNGVSGLIGTWRKANAIHGWFVDSVQHGVDDCRDYYVCDEALSQLESACKYVLGARGTASAEDVAKDRLPPREGFFFGGQELDDYYYRDLQYTLELIESARAMRELGFNIYYSSSW